MSRSVDTALPVPSALGASAAEERPATSNGHLSPAPGDLQLRRRQEELAHAARLSMMGELAASLAHELNQPLTAIMANAQVALHALSVERLDPDYLREILEDIVHDSRRAADVIQRARALVKRETHAFGSVDLGSLIREVLPLVQSGSVLRHVRLALDLEPGLAPVRGDKIQLQQVLLNLLLNAFDSVEQRPEPLRHVTVRARHDGAGGVIVSVSDQGMGLSPDVLENMFHRFFTTKPDGLGMGLSIGHSIITLHGGRLWAENNQEGGATFFFTLPGDRADAGADRDRHA